MCLLRYALIVFVLLTCSSDGLASNPAPRRIALLIGNWDYNLNNLFDANPPANYMSDLSNPCKDIALIKSRLSQNGFDVHDYCNMDKKTFETTTEAFSKSIKVLPKGSIVFIYYSGHGAQLHGRTYTLPVLFQLNQEAFSNLDAAKQSKLFLHSANDLGELLQKLTDDKNVALVIVMDNCRDAPVDESVAYNEAVSIRTPPNTLIQYATTAGDRASDNGAYASLLAQELARGGDIGDIMARVGIKTWQLWDQNRRSTYAETDVGPAFAALKFTPLARGEAPALPSQTEPLTVDRNIVPVRSKEDGVRLDIIWCEGPGEEQRYQFALDIARKIGQRSREFNVGRIQLKPLSEQKNAHGGYNVYRNVMRYDYEATEEKPLLVKIATAFPEANFLPRRGVGVGGRPTLGYVSAFVCGRLDTN